MPPRKQAPEAYPEQAPGGWTVEKIRSAIADLERGCLGPASRLTRALSRHPRYVQGREQFVGAVRGCPAEVLPAPITYGGVGTARRLAEEAGIMLSSVLSQGTEEWMIEWMRVMPVVIGVLSWDTTVRPWVPIRLTRWPLEAVRVDMYERKLYACLADGGGEEEIIAGNGTWVVGWAGGEFDFCAGLIRCLGEAWIRGINAGRNVAERSAANSVAGVLQKVPEGQDMQKPEVVDYQDHLENLQKGGRAGIMAPPGWDLPVAFDLGTKDGSPAIRLALDTSTTDLLVPWLMQDGTAKNEGGSLAKVEVLDGVLFSAVQGCVSRLWGEVAKDDTRIPGIITSQVVRPWVMYQLDPSSMAEEERPRGDVTPLAIRRVPDLEEDARLAEEARRSNAFWAEVGMIEATMRRDMAAEELRDLSLMRGVRLPESVLKERGEKAEAGDGVDEKGREEAA